ncbi:MAG: hypothetical protein JXQ90_09155 [Cyclobacteriaceae bacterium]
MRYIFFILTFTIFSVSVNAQRTSIDEFGPTDHIVKKKSQVKKNAPKRKKISYVVKNKSQHYLYGNPCMKEATQRMGFEYIVQTPGLPGSVKRWRQILDNSLIFGKLIVTRSPFWKMILNKRVKDCRQKSGDWVG